MNLNQKTTNKQQPKTNEEFLPPVPIPTIVPRFNVEDPNALSYLEENGYVVYKDIATPEEVTKGIELMWDFIERVAPGVKRDNWKTFDSKQWPDKLGFTGIVGNHSVGHSEFLWFVRGINHVQKVFSKVWDTEDLITSFDGFGIHRPWEHYPDWITTDDLWYHVDQNGIKKPTKLSVQGFLNFFPSGEVDGGLVVIPKSHKIFNTIFNNRPQLAGRGDYIPLFADNTVWEKEVKEAGLTAIKVCAEPGDFVLWDSRVIHCNAPATFPRPVPIDGSTLPPRRVVAYVCMVPKSRASSDVIAARYKAYLQGQTTSHWPDKCELSNTKEFKEYVPLQLSSDQKKLIPM